MCLTRMFVGCLRVPQHLKVRSLFKFQVCAHLLRCFMNCVTALSKMFVSTFVCGLCLMGLRSVCPNSCMIVQIPWCGIFSQIVVSRVFVAHVLKMVELFDDTCALKRENHVAKCCIVEALSVKKVGPWQEFPL